MYGFFRVPEEDVLDASTVVHVRGTPFEGFDTAIERENLYVALGGYLLCPELDYVIETQPLRIRFLPVANLDWYRERPDGEPWLSIGYDLRVLQD